MLVLVASVELFVSRYRLELSDPVVVSWRKADHAARDTASDSQLLCFGTSLTNNGIVPEVFESQLGKRTANLAVFGGPAPAGYYLFKHALEAGVRPDAVMFDCQDGPVARDRAGSPSEALWNHVRQWPEILDLGECLGLSWSARDSRFFATVMVSQALPSVRMRYEIRAKLLATIQGRPGSLSLATSAALRNARPDPGNPAAQAGLPRRNDPRPRPPIASPIRDAGPPRDGWERNPLCELYAERFVELAASRDIPIFWLLPPVSVRVQLLRDQWGFSAYSARIARELQARFPGRIVVVDGGQTRYSPQAFFDDLHLNRQGAISYSADVASIIGRRFADPPAMPNWVALPAR
jgi:hypothetical protein